MSSGPGHTAAGSVTIGGRRSLVTDALDVTAAQRPLAPALRDAEGAWNYHDLARASWRAAEWLARLGAGPGDRVMMRAVPSRVFVALLYGALRLRTVAVPVGTGVPPRGFARMVADARPAVVVDTLSSGNGAPGPALSSGTTVRSMYQARAAFHAPRAHSWAAPDISGPRGTDLALLLYTSGSTAEPKAVACPHSAVGFAARAVAARVAYRPDDVVFCGLPLSFDYGLYQVFLCALGGSELVLAEGAPHARLLVDLRASGASVVPVVPSLATMLVALARRDPAPSAVRLFTNTGEHLPPAAAHALRRHFPGSSVQMMFGTTECKRVSVLEPDGDLARPGSLGRPLDGTRVRIVGTDGQELPVGATGEITVRGPHVMAGYWNTPGPTSFRTEHGERTLYTGDRGRVDADGHLYFAGRADDRFKQRGTRVSAREIEAAATSLPGVTAAALLLPTPRRGAVLCVMGAVRSVDVLQGLGTLLEPAKVPGLCQVLDAFPLTGHGKTARDRLADLVDGTYLP
ncbi:class I adenylate-forming enzyme family protein [Streptomyces microflavus]|uniref:class I adenylate-forming enzyme family protein n=1 Tax=Streptomyces microflavus TaxID=1919 RepID=UPI003818962E